MHHCVYFVLLAADSRWVWLGNGWLRGLCWNVFCSAQYARVATHESASVLNGFNFDLQYRILDIRKFKKVACQRVRKKNSRYCFCFVLNLWLIFRNWLHLCLKFTVLLPHLFDRSSSRRRLEKGRESWNRFTITGTFCFIHKRFVALVFNVSTNLCRLKKPGRKLSMTWILKWKKHSRISNFTNFIL
jgi:hypothetical protein